MTCRWVEPKIVYVPGMCTTDAEARKVCDRIGKITRRWVDLFPNGTTPLPRALADGLAIVGGGAMVGYALCSEKKTKEKQRADLLIGTVGALLLTGGIYDVYCSIQQEKEARAKRLAQKLRDQLREPGSETVLILHSQGADIGLRAIELVGDLGKRLRVVTYGGAVAVPDHVVKEVINFRNRFDLVSGFAHKVWNRSNFRSRSAEVVSPLKRGHSLWDHHGAKGYVEQTRDDLLSISQPHLYCSADQGRRSSVRGRIARRRRYIP